jgi:predicted methyltransferase
MRASAGWIGALLLLAATPPSVASPVGAALADKSRPAEEVHADKARKPAAVIALAGIRAGSVVMDLVPHEAYFTRIFAGIVGPGGHVYDFVPSEADAYLKQRYPNGLPLLDPAHGNVSNFHAPLATLVAPQYLDVVFASRNYHDFHSRFFGGLDVAAVDRAIFAALKPGGVYVVLDYAAKPGSGLGDVDSLGRIDPEAVKQEIVGAGFRFTGASRVLANPRDNHTTRLSDTGNPADADLFLLKFQKPRR